MTFPHGISKVQTNWTKLFFYQKTVALYDITFFFTTHFFQKGDRTIDQMVQAARSGKQNIVEGTADGKTSSEMEMKLLNVARSSIMELREDYKDYLRVRSLSIWNENHPDFCKMLEYCRLHNQSEDYVPFLPRMTDEKIANLSLTLCYMVDKMMISYQKKLEQRFIQDGGIRERMFSARTGCRNAQKEEVERLQRRIRQLEAEIITLKQENFDQQRKKQEP